MSTKVLLVDDHELFVQAVRVALETGNHAAHDVQFQVVGSTTSGSTVVQLVERLRPDLVVLDVGLPGLDGLACLDQLRARFPEVKVVMLSAMEEPAQARAAISRGATAYILKSIHPDDMVSALRQIVESTAFVAVPVAEGASAAADHGLSDRELEILEHVSYGLTSAAIGHKLFVTEQTVKFHLTNVYRKLGVNNRTAASLEAHRRGIMRSPHADPVT